VRARTDFPEPMWYTMRLDHDLFEEFSQQRDILNSYVYLQCTWKNQNYRY